ncbi:Cna B-type domain-containing protein [Bulleidia sp. zg-1006]|uniref:Cna B-type domain-containing protein n=1 Tax=Bulleidia sp. zg-1006 TaxID=2806552 RepID=UPI00193A2F39|nr:Cna B-type domain-containing protein [Bulleidia sp. zg-1006]QRG87316.1 Cna B-type domain-containing protein [Bulleidia sp. zg-1006]
MKKDGKMQKLTSFLLVFIMLFGLFISVKPVFASDEVNDAGTITMKVSDIIKDNKNFDSETGNWVADYDVAEKMWQEMAPGLVPGDHVICKLEIVNDTKVPYYVQKNIETFSMVYKDDFTNNDYNQIYGRDLKLGFDFPDNTKNIEKVEIKNQSGAKKINLGGKPAYIGEILASDNEVKLNPGSRYAMTYHLYFIFESPNMSQNMKIWLRLAMMLKKAETTTINAKKVWVDNGFGGDKKDLYFQLRKNNNGNYENVGDKQKVEGVNEVTWTVPKYDDRGNEIKYVVAEVDKDDNSWNANSNWSFDVKGTVTDGFTFTNIYNNNRIKVEGSKTWNDNNNQDGKRPEKITINLMKKVGDGEVVKADSKIIEKDSEGNWKWSWENLPEYENKKKITYTVSEEVVEGYSVKINGYDITNSYTPGKTSIQVTKAWEDKNDQDGVRPDSITVKLLADGKETARTLTLTKADNWTGTFTNLDEYKAGKKIKYTVKEEPVGNGYKSLITKSGKNGYVVTNIRVPNTPSKKPNKPNKPLPKTGDASNPTLYASLLGLSGIAWLLLGLLRKKNRKEENK